MLKNITKITVIFLTLILILTSLVFATEAQDVNLISEDPEALTAEHKSANHSDIENNDLYIVNQSVILDKNVDGNVFIIGKDVVINSQINGDLFVMAQNLVIGENAYIYSNLFAISNNIQIKGITYNLYALASQTISIENGYIFRDAKAHSNTITVDGIIGRNASFTCDYLKFNEKSSSGMIYGNLEYTAKNEAVIPEGFVAGTTTFTPQTVASAPTLADFLKIYIINILEFTIYVVIVWLILLWLRPKFLSSTTEYVGKTSWKVLGFGTLALILLPTAFLILLLVQFTGTLAIITGLIYALLLILAKIIFTIIANNYICSKLKLEKNVSVFAMLILTSACVYILTHLPYVGIVLSFITILLGLGVMIVAMLPKKDKTVKEETIEINETKPTKEIKEIKEVNEVKVEKETTPKAKTTTKSTSKSKSTTTKKASTTKAKESKTAKKDKKD